MSRKKPKPPQTEQLFELEEEEPQASRSRPPKARIWTENKAHLIQRYISNFVQVTKHGTYIDGFAGPQDPSKPDSWAANLVIRSQPGRESPRLRHFHLFELDDGKVKLLDELRNDRSDLDIRIYPGDFNARVEEILSETVIREKEATFCLVDQRTFQCSWNTVERVARFKHPYKIEIFYFLANKWFDRAFESNSPEELARWWGRDDFMNLRSLKGSQRAIVLADRFRDELKYGYTQPFLVYATETSNQIMFFMIHASDHARANSLMTSAYDNTVPKRDDFRQLELEWSLGGSGRRADDS